MFAFWLGRIVSCLSFIILIAGATYACSCGLSSDCRSFSDAKNVFSGTLIKVEKDPSARPPLVHALFAPNEIYKGVDVGKIERLSFIDTECIVRLEPGVEYIVFQEGDAIHNSSNRTGRASDMKRTRDFLAGVLDRPGEASIYAFIQGLSSEELRGSAFYFDEKKVSLKEITQHGGRLDFNTSQRGKHRIKMIFPVSVTVDVEDGELILTPTVKVTGEKDRTIVEYDVNVATKPCDTRLITITKR